MRTNIMLDDDLVNEAFRYADVRTKRELVNLALREFVENHRRKDIRELRGINHLLRGFEPDECFYFLGNVERVRGKEDIDLEAGDPPPDLAVEADITTPSLNKLTIYARLGVAEVWRYGGGRFAILGLEDEGGGYAERAGSRFLPVLTRETLARFVEEGLTTRYPDWARKVREWGRGLDAKSGG